MKKKKITLIMPGVAEGGVAKMRLHLMKYFKDSGYELELVLFRIDGCYYEEFTKLAKIIQIELNSCKNPIKWYKFIREFDNYVKEAKPDAILSALEIPNLVTCLYKKYFNNEINLTVSVHNHYSVKYGKSRYFENMFLKHFSVPLYNVANNIIAVSNGVKESIIKYGARDENITTVVNPTFNKRFEEMITEEVKEDYFEDHNTKKIVAVGRLCEQKDYYTLIKAAKILKKEIDIKVLIIGDGPLRSYLNNYIDELKLNGCVILIGHRRNPYKYVNNSDLFVLSSLYEGLPNALIEALCIGTPVVSTDCSSGPKEILENGKLGRLVTVGDYKMLAEAMKETLLNTQDMKSIMLHARSKYSVEKSAKQYLKLLFG